MGVVGRAASEDGPLGVDHVGAGGVIGLYRSTDKFGLAPTDKNIVLGGDRLLYDALAGLEVVLQALSGKRLPAVAELRVTDQDARTVGIGGGRDHVGTVVQYDIVGLQADLLVVDLGTAEELDTLAGEVDDHAVPGPVVHGGVQAVGTDAVVGGTPAKATFCRKAIHLRTRPKRATEEAQQEGGRAQVQRNFG